MKNEWRLLCLWGRVMRSQVVGTMVAAFCCLFSGRKLVFVASSSYDSEFLFFHCGLCCLEWVSWLMCTLFIKTIPSILKQYFKLLKHLHRSPAPPTKWKAPHKNRDQMFNSCKAAHVSICSNVCHDLFLEASNDVSAEVWTQVVYWTAYVWLNRLIFLEKAVVGAVWGRGFTVKETADLYAAKAASNLTLFLFLTLTSPL